MLQFSLQKGRVILGPKAPVQLTLGTGVSRNWEGIVVLEDRGFLIITDTHPRSLLSFVPFRHN